MAEPLELEHAFLLQIVCTCTLWQYWVLIPHWNGQSLFESPEVLDHYNIQGN